MAKKDQMIEKCDCDVIHDDIVEQVKEKMPEEELLYDLAELFKVLAIRPGSRSFGHWIQQRCASVILPICST
jgi:hypothetical protein